jgi:ferric-dicitrate binding protein FerR (iron transport regulator)
MTFAMRSIRYARDDARLWIVSAVAIVILSLAGAAPLLAQASGVAGSLSSVSGSVQLQRAGATTAAGVGTPVNIGDRVITGAGGHAVVTLTDGSTLELGESSNLAIDSHALAPAGGRAGTQVSLFSGVVRSIVNATAGTPNFEVHTPNAVAAVRGTRFDTAYTDSEARPTYGDCHKFTDVAVYEGLVEVRNPANTSAAGVDVPAGYEVTVPCDAGTTLPGPLGMTGAHSGGAGGIGGGGSSASGPGAGGPTVVGGVPPPACPVCVP